MAEEQRMWSQRHTHESSTISYGQFGTPTYHSLSGEWEFLGQEDSAHDDDDDEESNHQHDNQSILKVFAEAHTPVGAVTQEVDAQDDKLLLKNLPELAPAVSLIKASSSKRYADHSVGHKGRLSAFGSAVWLSSDGIDSGNLTVPVIAFATGNATDTLQLVCLGRDEIEYMPEDDTGRKFRVPSLAGGVRTSIVGAVSISQVSFSQQNTDGKGDTFLLVRSLTQTTVFEPLLHRDAFVRSLTQEPSSLDLNPLVVLDASVTGGHTHVDCMFHPLNRRLLAIVDEGGNWSTWKIRGRRSTTARVLYRADLGCSGKVFSWKFGKRPEGVGLCFDGWHKVVWLSSNGQNIDRLLVCNRRTIKVFDTNGEQICDVDARLDRGSNLYILDVQAVPISNLCLILTSSRVLVFDLKEQEWKDPASSKGPSLMCAFQHFQNPANISLQMTQITLGEQILICLYSAISARLHSRTLSLLGTASTPSITISSMQSTILPVTRLDGGIATVILTQSEYVQVGGDPLPPNKRLIQALVQCEGTSIHSFWAIVTTTTHMKAVETARRFLRLPPNRSVHSKRYADDAYDENDMEGLISLNHDWNVLSQKMRVVTQIDLMTRMANYKDVKRVSLVVDTIQQQYTLPSLTFDMIETLQSLGARFRNRDHLPAGDIRCTLLSDSLAENVRVQDIESLSDTVQQVLDIQDSATSSYTISVCHGNSFRSLLSMYKSLFDLFVESLPAEVPDRFRVRKERQDRGIALEQYLSSRTIHAMVHETTTGQKEGQRVANTSQIIFSDPVHNDETHKHDISSASASQPLPQASSESKKSETKASPLLDSISRLQTYTRIGHDYADISPAESTATDNISSILSHLPTSCDDNPDKYDYQAAMMYIAAHKADSREGGVQDTSRARRKTARLARARERAEASTPATNFVNSGARDKEAGNNTRGAESRNKEMLPIRSAAARLPGISWHDRLTQSHDRNVFSDGHMPAGDSSPTPAHEDFTHTQPERGAFASRVEANRQSKAKKKRRVAGF